MTDEKQPGPKSVGERPETSRFRGPERASPYAVSRLSGPVSLVDSAREIERADQWIASTSSAKLEQIAEQMRGLRRQAEQVLIEAQANAELHRAEARFTRHPGKVYHLYERSPGRRYWSLLGPDDWRGTPPHPFVGSYRLEGDQSWTPLERVAERDRQRIPVADWLERGQLPGRLAPSSERAPDDAPGPSVDDAPDLQDGQPASPAARPQARAQARPQARPQEGDK
jgi:hypothetical protein